MPRPPHAYLAVLGFCAVLLLAGYNVRSWNQAESPALSSDHDRDQSPVQDASPEERASNSWKKVFPAKETWPNGANFTRTLMLATMSMDSTAWVQEELSDLLAPNGPIEVVKYVADDPLAPHHPPENKGNEANMYLSYIIDMYDSLPDVVIFMHAHRSAWHNPGPLDADATLMIRNLSPAKVMADGYVNLRCEEKPGCPEWIHTNATSEDDQKYEEVIFAPAWAELFPNEPLPATLSQPCCAQFAVSGQRIRTHPKSRYIAIRNWLYTTELSNYLAGRVFEYSWQYIFTYSPTVCPNPYICYCALYGMCFDSNEDLDEWLILTGNVSESQFQLMDWHEKADAQRQDLPTSEGDPPGDLVLDETRVALESKIAILQDLVYRGARRAFDIGRKRRGL